MSIQTTNIRYNTTQTSNEYLVVVRLHFFTFKTLHPRLQYLVVANIHSLLRQSFPGRLCDSFLIFALNIDCGCTLEPPREAVLTSTNNLYFALKHRLWAPDRTASHRGGSNEYQQSIFCSKT